MAADHPSRVAALVHLAGVGPGFDPYRSAVGRVLRFGALVDLPALGPVFDRALRPAIVALLPRSWWMQAQYGPRWASLPEPIRERTWLGMLRPKLSAVREANRVRADLARLAPRLRELAQPTLILSGTLDRVVPPRVGAELDAMLPNAERVVLPDARHTNHVVAPDEVARLITGFLDRAL